MTESESEAFVKAVNQVCVLLCKTFSFGYYDEDDIKQEAFIFGLEAMPRYDSSRPLENFLYQHIKNRLINFKRDKFHRNDPPCKKCASGDKCNDGEYCNKYATWRSRNATKRSLMQPHSIDDLSPLGQSGDGHDAFFSDDEILEKIDMNLSVELRSAYLKMKSGNSVPKARREEVLSAIRLFI